MKEDSRRIPVAALSPQSTEHGPLRHFVEATTKILLILDLPPWKFKILLFYFFSQFIELWGLDIAN